MSKSIKRNRSYPYGSVYCGHFISPFVDGSEWI